jgi:hypothetical protein
MAAPVSLGPAGARPSDAGTFRLRSLCHQSPARPPQPGECNQGTHTHRAGAGRWWAALAIRLGANVSAGHALP